MAPPRYRVWPGRPAEKRERTLTRSPPRDAHTPQRDMAIRDIIARIRHDGCGGLAAKAELLTGIEGVSSRPVRRIVLRATAGPQKRGSPNLSAFATSTPAFRSASVARSRSRSI